MCPHITRDDDRALAVEDGSGQATPDQIGPFHRESLTDSATFVYDATNVIRLENACHCWLKPLSLIIVDYRRLAPA
jgi:hypothetical protein